MCKRVGNNFSKVSNASGSEVLAKSKKASKVKRSKNQSVESAENKSNLQIETDLSSIAENEFETSLFEKADRALDEIGELMMKSEPDNNNQDNVLALADDERLGEVKEDFMEQKLYKVLTGENPKPQLQDDSEGEEIQDCFDKEVILQPQTSLSSADVLEEKREITLSADFQLTEAETIREKESVRHLRKTQNEFSNALAHGVL